MTTATDILATARAAARKRATVLARHERELDHVDAALIDAISAARDAGLGWAEIGEATGFESPQAATMFYRRKTGAVSAQERPDTLEGLSAKDAAEQFGVSIPTFLKRLQTEDSEVAQRTTVIDGWYRGRAVPRYIVA